MLGSSSAGVTEWPLGLMVRTAASQAANVEFKSRRGHCGYRTMASSADCGSAHPGSVSVPLRSAQSNSPLDCLRPGSHPTGRSHSGNCSGL